MESENYSKPAPATGVPIQVWLEIFEYIDSYTLLQMTLVCKHFNRLIFNYMTHRFQLKLVSREQKSPPNGVNLDPERIYKHLHISASTLDSVTLMVIVRHAPNLLSLKLSLVSLNLKVLMYVLKICTRLTELSIEGRNFKRSFDFDQLLWLGKGKAALGVSSLDLEYKKLIRFDKELEPCNVIVAEIGEFKATCFFPTVLSMGLDIKTDLEKFECDFLSCFPNITRLEIVARVEEQRIVERLAPNLKVLKMEVQDKAAAGVYQVRLPTLEVLALKIRSSYQKAVLQNFLLGCASLKTALFVFSMSDDFGVFPMVAQSLPLVEKLQITDDSVITLDELHQMSHLKVLSIKGASIVGDSYAELSPSLEKLEFHDVMFTRDMSDVFYRFPNLRKIAVTKYERHFSTYQHFDKKFYKRARSLKEFKITLYRAGSDIVNFLQTLTQLEMLSIDARIFAKSNFGYLKKLMCMPLLKCLDVRTESELPRELVGRVAASNPACRFVLNGTQVEPVWSSYESAKRLKLDFTSA
ncbi:uncharacterized protein LOC134225108 isoform X2 [Armigeres subalbatus]|uniref:uncharacterized protein LOC134225108 isoform X2 n=1 Tax=Armigeres subalbatus TaxID=124917 RepID=UPI002ED44B92